MKYDFSGYVTKNDLKCTDGRIIRKDAFKHMDGKVVPLVWQHMHDTPENVLGHMTLENREDGVYGYGLFNDSDAAKAAKASVEHSDIDSMSIFANQLKENAKNVLHGVIREVSLVLAGANPGAKIENVVLAHSDGSGSDILESEGVIWTGESLSTEELEHAAATEETLEDVFNTFTDKQKDVVYAMLTSATAEENLEQSATNEDDDNLEHNEGGTEMKKNVFENTDKTNTSGMQYEEGKSLSHAEIATVFADAINMGSLKQAIVKHAGTYGIDNLSVLFPEAQQVGGIDLDKREMGWVKTFLGGINKVPWGKIKSLYADLTEDEARAKGYVTGNEKFEEVFPLFSRITESTTIYKKQKLDNDDLIDIKANFNIVNWLKSEMNMMLREEIARAELLGDGRSVTSRDKVSESHIRPIYTDDDIYTIKIQMASTVEGLDELEAIITGMEDFEGDMPVCFAPKSKINEWRLLKNSVNGDYRWKTISEVAAFLGVKSIEECPVMKNVTRDVGGTDHDLVCIIVDLKAYTAGTNAGGQVKDYEQFDIDFNQHKYLKETRLCGAMTKIRSAVTVEKAQAEG